MVSIEVKSRSKSIKDLATDELTTAESVSELVQLISITNGNKSIHRIRLTKLDGDKQVPLDVTKTLAENGFDNLAQDISLQVKDLGPQISWRTVYVVEYIGPLILQPLIYWLSTTYGFGIGKPFEASQSQKFAVVLSFLHYVKREYETIFVHKFSNATMPAAFIFRNSAHYWILSGIFVSLFSFAPPSLTTSLGGGTIPSFLFHFNELSPLYNWALTGLWALFEVSNYTTHANLANLRAHDSKKYAIPYGYGFNLVSCPNYLFEILSWLTFSVLVGNWSAFIFTYVGGYTMTLWGLKRHRRYLNTFGDDYKKLKRNVIFPKIL